MLVDLLDAVVEGDGEVGQRTQVTPFIFTLLWEAERERRRGREEEGEKKRERRRGSTC